MNYFDTIKNDNLKYNFLKVLIDENRFKKFNRNDKCKLTKKMKKLSSLKVISFKSKKKIIPNIFNDKDTIIMGTSGAWCVDLFRHIRNSIFHGRAEVITKKGTKYFVFKDYSSNSCDKQTAYICLNEDNYNKCIQYYNEALKQIEKTNSYADKNYRKREAA